MPRFRRCPAARTLTLAAFALLAGYGPTAGARALHAEVGVGLTHFMDRGDGVWYQQAFAHQLRLNAPALMLGVHGPLGEHAGRRFDWHVDFFHLGRASSNAWAVMDGNYDPHRHVCLAHCDQPSHFISSGTLWGFAAMLGAEPLASRRLEVRAGPWLYHQSWSAVVPNFYSSTGYPQANGWAPWSSSGDAIHHAASGWGVGLAGGASWRWHAYRATLMAFFNNRGFGLGADPWPPIWRAEYVVFAGRSF